MMGAMHIPRMDWENLDFVIGYARRHLGPGMTIFKHPARRNYNITHTSRPDRYAGCEIVYQT